MEAMLDTECYRNFFLVKFTDELGRTYEFPQYEGRPLDRQGLANALAYFKNYTFNGNHYDMPMLTLALYGATCDQLKNASDDIIVGQLRDWQFYQKYNIQLPDYIDHIDLIEVAPGVRISLKAYAGRNHSKKMQDLPIEPSSLLTHCQMQELTTYCGNDLTVTWDLRNSLKAEIKLREELSAKYNVDLRSKSDAQIAEAIIKTQLSFKPNRRYIPHGYYFYCDIPANIKFATPDLAEVLSIVRNAKFVVEDKEQAIELGILEGVRTGVRIPKEIEKLVIAINGKKYKFGIGGLHSQEKSVSYYNDADGELFDIDVKSYYPSNILNAEMFPEQIGVEFIEIYRAIYIRRLYCKGESARLEKIAQYLDGNDKVEALEGSHKFGVEAEGLKIVLNGTFGKLFSMYSVVYAPELGIKTTIMGQLDLLMLIEMLELSGIYVLSANTDGLVVKVNPKLKTIFADVVSWWEAATSLEMEYKKYKSIHFRDVNNYIAIDTDGKVKRKGVFGQGGVTKKKHPEREICSDAVIEYLTSGKSIRETIENCDDIRKFIVIRAAKGGAINKATGEYLGKVVRWYYSAEPNYLAYFTNGNKVAGSDFAVPCMTLPDTKPDDVHHEYYTTEAIDMLKDIGVIYGSN